MEYFNEDEIYKYFENEIKNASAKKISKLREEINNIKKSEVNRIVAEVKDQIQESLGMELKDIDNEQKLAISQIYNEFNAKLAKKREEFVQDVFHNVKDKLIEFVKTKEYLELMKIKVQETAKYFDNTVVVFKIGANDSEIQDVIKNYFPKEYSIEKTSDIKIGGFFADSQEKGIEIDESLDSKLENKKQWFYSNSHLFIR